MKLQVAIVMVAALSATLVPACGGKQSAKQLHFEQELAVARRSELTRNHEQAKGHFIRAIAIAPSAAKRAIARRQWIDTLLSWRELEPAREQLRLLAGESNNAAAWHDLGIVSAALGDPAAAVRAFLTAIELAPLEARSRIALAALHWSTRDFASALQQYEALLKLQIDDATKRKVQWAIETLQKLMLRN